MNEPILDNGADRRQTVALVDNVPAWISTISLVVGVIGGGGVLYSRVEATEVLASKNEARITEQEAVQARLDKEISVHLTRIQTDLEYIKERVK